MTEPRVKVDGLGKCYRVFPDAQSRLKEIICFGKKKFHTDRWALQDINFELHAGQCLGIIGFNGAGKSTLLKLLTGTSEPTTGSFHVNGSVSSLLELGAGFHSEFSGKDNIFMNAIMQGVPKAVVAEQYDKIAEFSELGDFLHQPVRTYSSGMAMRLGFSAAMIVDPDILILDEVLAVGDIHFQKKCMDKFKEFRRRDKTILFVSHSVYHIREICDRVIWLHEGEMVMDGDPIEVTDEYENRMLELQARENSAAIERAQAASTGELKNELGLASIDFSSLTRGDEPEPCTEFEHGDPLTLRIRYSNPQTDDAVRVAMAINRNDGIQVTSTRTPEALKSALVENEVTLRMPHLHLLAGEYTVSLYLTDDTGAHIMDQKLFQFRFRVTYDGKEKGVYLGDCRWESPRRDGEELMS